MPDLDMAGEIVAESDISVSPPDHSERKLGRATVLTLPRKGIWRDGLLQTTVYIPASTIRGALRNGASRAVAARRPTTPEDFLLLAKGGIMDRKQASTEQREVDYKGAKILRCEQPIVSLFGAMERKIAGRWQIGDAVPIESVTASRKGQGVRAHPFQRQPELAHFMAGEAYERFLESDRKRVEANLVEDEAESTEKRIFNERRKQEPDLDRIATLEAEAKQKREQVAALREQAGGAVNIQQILGGWEAIPQGTRMSHRMRLRNASADELAWAFFALRRLARDGRFGAHESRGEGYFSARYDLRVAAGDGDFEPAGALRIEALELCIDSENEDLRAAWTRSATVLDELGTPAA